MASVGKKSIQFPAEDDYFDCDCPAAVPVDEVASANSFEKVEGDCSSCDCPAAVRTEEVPSHVETGAALANGHVNTSIQTDEIRLNDLQIGEQPEIICSDDEDEESSVDEESDIEDANDIEGQKLNEEWKIDDGADVSCECFICDHVTKGYEAADLMKTHVESSHNFSFEKLKSLFKLDYPSFVQFVRWARDMKKHGVAAERVGSIWTLTCHPKDLPWASDQYLLPPSKAANMEASPDYFLTLDFFGTEDKPSEVSSVGLSFEDLISEIKRLKLDKQRMAEIFQRVISGNADEVPSAKGRSAHSPSRSPKKDRRAQKKSPSRSNPEGNDAKNHNKWYFDSYDDVNIHHEMIFDQARTNAYLAAIKDQAEHIKDKVVMDLGCGSGILSMFCAQQGAKLVHAIDKSEIIYDAMSNSFENNFDKVIQFHHVDLDNDDTSDLEKEGQVDVLVSEFMGYFLFFEGMTESFIRARKKYLKPGGVLMPDKCVIELAPIGPTGIYQRKVRCWNAVYGFKMPALKERFIREAVIDIVRPDEMIGNRVQVKDLNLRSCLVCDIFICEDFEFEFNADTEFCGVAGFFSVDFNGPSKTITLATSPWDPFTHWRQTLFLFSQPFLVKKGQKMKGSITSSSHKDDPRWLIVLLDFEGQKFTFEVK